MLVSSAAAGVSVLVESAAGDSVGGFVSNVGGVCAIHHSVARQSGDFCSLRTGVGISNSGTGGNAI
eukprot:4627360-Pleurochrysis_carterae.AAC.1